MVGQNTKLSCIHIKDIEETVIMYEHGGRQNIVVVSIGFP